MEEKKDELIAGFKMSGEYVKNLKQRDFVVLAAENREIRNPEKPEDAPKIKTVLKINLVGDIVEWYPNQTSLHFIAKKQGGYKLSDLIGYKGELITIRQQVGKELREVIYVKGAIQE